MFACLLVHALATAPLVLLILAQLLDDLSEQRQRLRANCAPFFARPWAHLAVKFVAQQRRLDALLDDLARERVLREARARAGPFQPGSTSRVSSHTRTGKE
jgi:hypothetical protein